MGFCRDFDSEKRFQRFKRFTQPNLILIVPVYSNYGKTLTLLFKVLLKKIKNIPYSRGQ